MRVGHPAGRTAAPRASRSEARVRLSRTSATERAISSSDRIDGLGGEVVQAGDQRVEQLGWPSAKASTSGVSVP